MARDNNNNSSRGGRNDRDNGRDNGRRNTGGRRDRSPDDRNDRRGDRNNNNSNNNNNRSSTHAGGSSSAVEANATPDYHFHVRRAVNSCVSDNDFLKALIPEGTKIEVDELVHTICGACDAVAQALPFDAPLDFEGLAAKVKDIVSSNPKALGNNAAANRFTVVFIQRVRQFLTKVEPPQQPAKHSNSNNKQRDSNSSSNNKSNDDDRSNKRRGRDDEDGPSEKMHRSEKKNNGGNGNGNGTLPAPPAAGGVLGDAPVLPTPSSNNGGGGALFAAPPSYENGGRGVLDGYPNQHQQNNNGYGNNNNYNNNNYQQQNSNYNSHRQHHQGPPPAANVFKPAPDVGTRYVTLRGIPAHMASKEALKAALETIINGMKAVMPPNSFFLNYDVFQNDAVAEGGAPSFYAVVSFNSIAAASEVVERVNKMSVTDGSPVTAEGSNAEEIGMFWGEARDKLEALEMDILHQFTAIDAAKAKAVEIEEKIAAVAQSIAAADAAIRESQAALATATAGGDAAVIATAKDALREALKHRLGLNKDREEALALRKANNESAGVADPLSTELAQPDRFSSSDAVPMNPRHLVFITDILAPLADHKVLLLLQRLEINVRSIWRDSASNTLCLELPVFGAVVAAMRRLDFLDSVFANMHFTTEKPRK